MRFDSKCGVFFVYAMVRKCVRITCPELLSGNHDEVSTKKWEIYYLTEKYLTKFLTNEAGAYHIITRGDNT
jgi:hypothetical protein